MRFYFYVLALSLATITASAFSATQIPFLRHDSLHNKTVSPQLFSELEELSRIVDISYCVTLGGFGVSKPFSCLSRCAEFPDFELVKTWNTGPLMSDSCGFIALDHSRLKPRIVVAFRGTYSITNTVVDLSTIPQEYVPYPGDPDAPDKQKGAPHDGPVCNNCTVHTGFYSSWRAASSEVVDVLEVLRKENPDYALILVGHSLGGAVAALAGLDFIARGWDPLVTTYGEPRLGNKGLMEYIDVRFGLDRSPHFSSAILGSEAQKQLTRAYERKQRFRRVTHIDDPVPQLPLTEWGFRMHAGEIFISKKELSPDIEDVWHCVGDEDPLCIASQDTTLPADSSLAIVKRDNDRLVHSGADEAHNFQTIKDTIINASLWKEVGGSMSTIPARYKLWQMLFAHRDYFWRLGLCVPTGSPWDWGSPGLTPEENARMMPDEA